MTRLPFAGALAGLMLAACQPAAPTESATATSPAVSPAPAPPAAASDSLPLGDFKIVGVLTKVEHGAYPMYAITVDTGDGKEPLSLSYNMEEVKTSSAYPDLDSFKGKRVAVDYTRKNELDMLTMMLDGKDILDHDPAYPMSKPESSVTGKLDGVTELSGGDLPDTLTVVDSAGKKYDFDAFVSEPAVVAANGKTVTVGYDTRPREDVTAFAPAP